MTEGFDNTIASEEEAERLARGKDDIQPGPDGTTAQQESSDAADTMVDDQADSDPAPK